MKDVFENGYVEVTLPVDAETFPKQYGYIIDRFRNDPDVKESTSAMLTLTVVFDTTNNETRFNMNVYCNFPDGSHGSFGECNIPFDCVTAEVFRVQAMRKLLQSFNNMAKCRMYMPEMVSA